jgi:nitrite reductase/ring-hydroxylating ferredoxin subunit
MNQGKSGAPAGGCTGCAKAPKWRTDFPIEWESDHYVTRREMVKFLTLGSALLAAANWVTAGAMRLLRRGGKTDRFVANASDLDRQGSILFRYPTDRDPCIAVRTPEGKLVAYSQVCTHLSCAVVYNRKENNLRCPCHNGVFDLDRGAPIAGPPTRPLPKIKIEQRGDKLFATEWEA